MRTVCGTFLAVLCFSGILFARESKVKFDAAAPTRSNVGVESGVVSLKNASSILMGGYLSLLSEDTLDLARLRGKTTAVDFWATWWAPCNGKIADLVEFAQKIAGRMDFTFVSMCRDAVRGGANQKQAKDFLDMVGVNYAVLWDDVGHSLVGRYHINMFPSKLLFDGNGRLLKVLSYDDPLGQVREYLETKK